MKVDVVIVLDFFMFKYGYIIYVVGFWFLVDRFKYKFVFFFGFYMYVYVMFWRVIVYEEW